MALNTKICNIAIGSLVRAPEDILLFFGEIPDSEELIIIQEDSPIRLGAILKDLGIFKSIGEARRNNWDLEIPEGCSFYRIGKLHHEIHILKITENNPSSEFIRFLNKNPNFHETEAFEIDYVYTIGL